MQLTSGLMKSLNGYFGWNKSRMNCFVHMLLGLIAVRTVNLQEIALAFDSSAKVSSRYRRLQRFFALFQIDLVCIARWIFKLFFAPTDKFYVLIDRTNWYWGKQKINVFMLSIAYEGLAIPLLWRLLDKGGSSNFEEQKSLLNQFIEAFGTQGMAGLLADREFASGKLFKWLNKRKIPFYIRIKEGSIIRIKGKKWWKAQKVFNDLRPKTAKIFPMGIQLFEQNVFLAGSRSERGELMIVATNQPPHNAIAIYLRRWEIENLFQGLKGRGFRFEETHMTHPERISKLLVLLAVGFAWAHKIGEWQALKKPILSKQFRHFKTPQHTFFRYGLDHVRELILHRHNKSKLTHLKECLNLIYLPSNERRAL